ncbi:YigZ family protein [Porcipelethomonas sp.]|uniref:YigZ family protein n=1 Tax=Porcipelethomonas sp. TaxID=2981675 RepID=UPI003EF7A8A7
MNYTTIKSPVKASFIEKRSEFIGYISPVSTNEQAVEFINRIKAEHRKAKHNVYAYILRDDNITRYSDDGEPQGTAGVPVLDVLQKNNLTDICCVVTRYFGGILLGGGGLVRAYSHCASIAVDAAEILNMHYCITALLEMDYELYGKVNYILPEFEVKLINQDFGTSVQLTVNVKSDAYDSLCKKLIDTTCGKISIKKISEQFDNF